MQSPGEHIQSVSFIGSGNLATRLGQVLQESGVEIKQVWSRDPAHTTLFATRFSAIACNHITDLSTDTGLIFICIPDDAIPGILPALPKGIRRLVHVSGSMPLSVLDGYAEQTGVFYPLQSFLKNREISWKNIPVCIEANTTAFTQLLFSLGEKISRRVEPISSEQRFKLHTAAVIVNNFTNYLFSLGYDLLTSEGLSFDLLLPLIHETAARLGSNDPAELQTGPAKRKDEEVIRRHIQALDDHPEIKEVYEFITARIIKKP